MRKAFLFAFLVAAASTTLAHADTGAWVEHSKALIASSALQAASNGRTGGAQ